MKVYSLQSSTAANLVKQLGMDHDIVKEMIADGYKIIFLPSGYWNYF